ncbi:MAG: hypothetical protein ABIC57_00055, partial [bacterium]
QIESLLDVAMAEDFWNGLWAEEGPLVDYTSEERIGHSIPTPYVDTYLPVSSLKCSNWNISARRSSEGVDSFFLGKDEVLEIDLRDDEGNDRSGDDGINISWDGDADYLILKFYDVEADTLTYAVALSYGDNEDEWYVEGLIDTLLMDPTLPYTFTLTDTSNPDVVRIRPVGGDSLLDISGLAPGYFQFGELKAHCYINEVYREYISQFMLRGSAPSVFDYALFDAEGTISGANIE